ncbi:hypothetical protein B0J17DRAFT_288805 [Rhizoctonia solani]|nr:hypothetical protein B0J17DRAFT_288805 [Rhizoctonia solani]
MPENPPAGNRVGRTLCAWLFTFAEELELKFIQFDEAGHTKANFGQIMLPSDSFPSLRRLYLPEVQGDTIYHRVWALKPMVSKLLSVVIGAYCFDFDKGFIPNLVQPIYENSPHLESLSLYMSVYLGKPRLLGFWCKLLSVMPLKVLALKSCCGIGDLGNYPTTHYGSIFPHLRRLRLSNKLRLTDWKMLPKIAKACPNLEWLYIYPRGEVDYYEPLNARSVNHRSFQPIEIQMLEIRFDPELTSEDEKWRNIWSNMVRFLTTIWPNAYIVTGKSLGPISEWDDY